MVSEFSVFALLDDPVRRKLYDYVIGQGREVSRSEAAEAAGIQRTLAAFHLDRLVETGLLDATFRRPAGRAGPGAGRPAKLYRRGAGEYQVSVPPRSDRQAAELLAEVVEVTGAEPELQRVARSRGATAGRPAPGPDRPAGRRNVTSTSPASASRSRWKAASVRWTPTACAASLRLTPWSCAVT